MADPVFPPPSSGRLSRAQLLKVLALPKEAKDEQIQRAGIQLLVRLESRHAEATPSAGGAALKLRAEIDALEEALVNRSPTSRGGQRDRSSLAGAMLGIVAALALMIAWSSGFRISREDASDLALIPEDPAKLILVGRLPGATLHVLDADREKALLETAAENARLELPPGRYAIEVRREDCPDRWTRSVYFESGAEYRFEPALCLGEGRLVVRSNVLADRLLIDGLDVGSTGKRPHLVGVGDHAVRVEKKGFQPFEGRVRMKPNDQIELRAELVATNAGGGGAKGQAAAPVGRPLPVTKGSPTRPPVSEVKPLPFEVGNFGTALGVEDLGLPPRRSFLRENLGPLPESGSTAWHDMVSRQLLAQYDKDGSGAIDQLAESESISCAVWTEIEEDFNRGGLGLSMARYFGFDGTEWHPGALGVSRGHRSAVYAKMNDCGLAK